MAKSSVPGLDRIRALFTSAERAVLESTTGKALAEASRKQLDKTLAQARSLRDKWRDLHVTQSRATKRSGGGVAAANARSREKSDVFTAAIERVQARLAGLGLAAAAGRPAAQAVKKPTRRKPRPAKPARAALAKGDGQSLRFDVAKQRSAKASATAARLKLDGKVTRRGGHTLAAGKRRQAARDRRGR